jgi:hypothetical protein
MKIGAKNLALLLAVLACNSEFVFPLLTGVQIPYVSPGWLLLPPILVYLLLTKQLNFAGFLRSSWAMVVIVGLCVVSEMFVFQAASVVESGGLFTISQTLNCLVVYFIFFSLIKGEEDLRHFLDYMAISTLMNALLLAAITFHVIPSVQAAQARLGSQEVTRFGLGDPNITYCFMCMGSVFWLTLAAKPFRQQRLRTAAALACFGGAVMPIVAGLSRGALVSFATSMFLGLLILAWGYSFRAVFKYTIPGLLLAAVVVLQLNSDRVNALMDRIQHTVTGSSAQYFESSARQRYVAITWLGHELLEPDFLGRGYDKWFNTSESSIVPHFSFADLYITGGIIPLVLMVGFLARNYWLLGRGIRREGVTDNRISRIVLLMYTVALLVMWMSLTIIWMKLLWAALAVVARANQLPRERTIVWEPGTDATLTLGAEQACS